MYKIRLDPKVGDPKVGGPKVGEIYTYLVYKEYIQDLHKPAINPWQYLDEHNSYASHSCYPL